MSRIEAKFKDVKAQGRAALVNFIMAGDPSYEDSLAVLKSLPAAGADVIEVGMPFADPAADGVTIQLAGQRALKAGMTLEKTLALISAFRESDHTTPIILMGYANPIFSMGYEAFIKAAKEAGVDGLIIVDLPPEEDGDLRKIATDAGVDMIRLLTPTTKGARLEKVLDGASGFLYYVSITGVTGTASADLSAVSTHISQIKAHSDLPIAIGFGIKTPEDVADMAKIGDAVVVGSAIVDKVKDVADQEISSVSAFVKTLRAAL